MERQFEGRQAGYGFGQPSQYGVGRTQDRWSARAGPSGGYDRFSNGSPYGAVHTGELSQLYVCSSLVVGAHPTSPATFLVLR